MPLNLFLREHEKRNVAEWASMVEDKSISTRLLDPFWNWLVAKVPKTVAPNVLSLASLLFVLHAYYVTTSLSGSYPDAASGIAALFLFIHQNLDAIDGKQARRTMNYSSVGELFDQACDTIAVPFLVITVCRCLGYYDMVGIWFMVQTVQLVFLKSHFKAWMDRERTVRWRLFGGPGEALMAVEALLIIRAVCGLPYIWNMYMSALRLLSDTLEWFAHHSGFKQFDMPPEAYTEEQLAVWGPKVMYYAMLLWVTARVLLCKRQLDFIDPVTHQPTGDSISTAGTKWGLLLCLGYRAAPSFLLWLPKAAPTEALTELDVICDGVMMSIVTCDIILAKMARRNLHNWVPIMYMLSIFDRLACLILVALYLGAVFGDLCTYMNLPLLTNNVNVYCDGVYDLCHIGHKNLFKAALKFGTRLYVGVVGDKDAMNYKRPPIMNMEERAAEVEACKGVHKVIRNSPCFGITHDFIEEHMLHVVCHGYEYTAEAEAAELRKQADEAEAKGDAARAEELRAEAAEEQAKADKDPKALSKRGAKYYLVPYELGITEILPRTPGLSTSDLIKRCKQVGDGRNDK